MRLTDRISIFVSIIAPQPVLYTVTCLYPATLCASVIGEPQV
jgi:hypothetical protein